MRTICLNTMKVSQYDTNLVLEIAGESVELDSNEINKLVAFLLEERWKAIDQCE